MMTISSEDTCIIECEGIDSCKNQAIYAMDGINQFLINTPQSIDNDTDLFCRYNFNESCIMGQNCGSICNQTFVEQTSGINIDEIQMVLGFNNNEDKNIRTCSESQDQPITECMIFVDATTTRAQCTKDIDCRVICIGLTCTAIIDGSSANTLYLETSIESNFETTGKRKHKYNSTHSIPNNLNNPYVCMKQIS